MKFWMFMAMCLLTAGFVQAQEPCSPCDVSWEVGRKGIYYATQKGRADKKNGKLSSAENANGAVLHVHVEAEAIECTIEVETDEGIVEEVISYEETDLSFAWEVYSLDALQTLVDESGLIDGELLAAQAAVDTLIAECSAEDPDEALIAAALTALSDLGIDASGANLAEEKELEEDEEGPAAWHVPQENILDGKNDYLMIVTITDNCIDDEEAATTVVAACLEIRGFAAL